nr:TIGR03986 family CRISPR-associated RAMP protein [Fusobacterium gastrosuis]
MAKKGKILEVDIENKKIRIEREPNWIQVGKAVFNRENLKAGEFIEYEIKGANFDFKRKLEDKPDFNNKKDNYGNKFGNSQAKSNLSKPTVKEMYYPYNFVSLGNPETIKKEREEGRSEEYKNKQRYSGKLVCTLTNLTPIFTSGNKKEDGIKNHFKEEFLYGNGKYIIPASTLKGEIRNIIEVITTSCIKNVSDERLEKRETESLKSIGLIRRKPTDETSGLIVEADRIKINRENVLAKLKEFSFQDRKGKINLKEGFYKIKVNSKIRNYIFKDKNSPKIDDLKIYEDCCNGNEEAILWISSNIQNKRYEKILIPRKNGRTFQFSKQDYEDLTYLISQRKKREEKAGNSKFYLKEIEENEPVILKEENGKINLTFSEFPRLRFKLSPYDLIPEPFRACSNKDKLCFACKLFGTTGNDNAQDTETKMNSLAGKIYFSDLILEKAIENEFFDITLKPLGEPHPSMTSFYLKNGSYNDENATIRGRKFYWHHSDKIKAGKNYKIYEKSIVSEKKEKFNSTIRALKPGNKFNFEISFKNLTDEELGVLIYALELEEDLLHKVGKAKALGFGSSKITIEEFFLNSEEKYSNFFNPYINGDKQKFISIIKEKYLNLNRKEIKELKIILKNTNNLDFSKSPFPEVTNKKGELNSLNWFIKMKKDYEENFILPEITDY